MSRRTDSNVPRRLLRLLPLIVVGFVFAIAITLLLFFPPSNHSFYPRCYLHSATGLHCPGCGLTRSAYSLLHGEFLQALAYNVLCPLILPILTWSMLTSVWNATYPDRSVNLRLPAGFLRVSPFILMALLLSFAILRNIPAYPFNLLAPHELTP